jgi:hypothetical protein
LLLCRQVYYFVKSRQFDWAMLAVILTNSALMAVTWYGEPVVLLDTLEYINKAYTAIYIAEAALKVSNLPKGQGRCRSAHRHMCLLKQHAQLCMWCFI